MYMMYDPMSFSLVKGRGPPRDRSALLGQTPAIHLKWMHHVGGYRCRNIKCRLLVPLGWPDCGYAKTGDGRCASIVLSPSSSRLLQTQTPHAGPWLVEYRFPF